MIAKIGLGHDSHWEHENKIGQGHWELKGLHRIAKIGLGHWEHEH